MDGERTLPMRRRWLAGLLCVVLAGLVIAVCVHYRVGRNWLTYLGHPMYDGDLDIHAPGDFALTTPSEDMPGLSNFAKVSDELYRGAQADREGYEHLKSLGVRTIINLRELGSDRDEMEGTGLRYIHIRMNPADPEDEEFARFLKVFEDPRNLPAFVHCQKGSDRTGTACAIYRVCRQGWPVEEAARELPAFGYHDVWVGLLEYLENLDPDELKSLADGMTEPEIEVID